MAGLLDIFGTGGLTELGLLGVNPEEINRYRDDAQAQALYKLAENMFAGGPTGASIAKGLAQGQQAYKEAMRGQMTDMLTQQKLAEAIKAKQNEQMLNKLVSSAYQPETSTTEYQRMTPQQLERAAEPGFAVPKTTTVTPANFDIARIAPAMMAIPGGIEKLSSLAKVVPELRKAGVTGQQNASDNPFTLFVNDPTIPAPLRAIAGQYQKSYAAGLIDPETADKRVGELGQRVQAAQQFQQTQDLNAANRQSLNLIAQGNLELRRQAEANKPEQFSYPQKKEFDQIQDYKEDARKAAANAAIAGRAVPLLEQAYSGVVEAGAKGILGAVGYETEAKIANDRLKQMSNQLAVNAPKFSGPTSDRDAARYDEAVGDLANPKKSIESKKSALKEIQSLSRKAQQYATQAEQYFYGNNKSLRGFEFKENPYDGM